MVYITSGLFGHNPAQNRHSFSTLAHTHVCNNMVESQATVGLGKRKRRPEDDTEGPSSKHNYMPSTTPDRPCSSTQPTSSRSSPTREGLLRLYAHDPAPHEASAPRPPPRSPASSNNERRPVKQMKRINPRISLVKAPSHLMDIEPDPMPSSPPVQRAEPHTNSDLRPCHACSTAPKRKRDLENYMDCRRCEERTCYICARECLGCQKAICKKCIVEVGQEGEPWCLECYSRHINA